MREMELAEPSYVALRNQVPRESLGETVYTTGATDLLGKQLLAHFAQQRPRPHVYVPNQVPIRLAARASEHESREEPNRASAPGGCPHRDGPHAAGAARPPDVYTFFCEPLAEVETACVDRYASVQ